jgi:hypothetical protein
MSAFKKGLTALMINAAMDPNPTREFIFGEPFLNALRPSKSKSDQHIFIVLNHKIIIEIRNCEHTIKQIDQLDRHK